MIKILGMIEEDTRNDAEKFDGRPFNGRTVAKYFGNQGAAIAGLSRNDLFVSNIVKSILEKEGEKDGNC